MKYDKPQASLVKQKKGNFFYRRERKLGGVVINKTSIGGS